MTTKEDLRKRLALPAAVLVFASVFASISFVRAVKCVEYPVSVLTLVTIVVFAIGITVCVLCTYHVLRGFIVGGRSTGSGAEIEVESITEEERVSTGKDSPR